MFFCFLTAADPIRLPRSLKPRRNLRANFVLMRRPIINSQIASNRRQWNLGRMEGSPGLRRRLSASSLARIQMCWCGHGGCGWGGGGRPLNSSDQRLRRSLSRGDASAKPSGDTWTRQPSPPPAVLHRISAGVVQVCGLIFIKAKNLYCLNSNFSPQEIKC